MPALRCRLGFAFAVLLAATSSAPVFAQAPQLDALVAKLQGASGAERLAAIDALGDQRAAAAAATPALAKLLADADEETRARAARALGSIGPGAADAVDPLATTLDDASPRVRSYAAYALGSIGPGAARSFEKLAAHLTDADPQVRREVVKAVRRLQIDRAKLIPVVVKILESSSPAEVVPAMAAIAEGGKQSVPALIEALNHPEARYWACQILGQIGADSADAVPAVAKVLTDERPEVRREAVLCLGHIGPAAKSATTAVLNATADKDPGTRAAAVWASVTLEAPAAEAVAKFQALSNDADPLVQLVAAWGTARYQSEDAELRKAAVAKGTAALKSENPRLRAAGARVLVDLKVHRDTDPEAVEGLLHAIADGDGQVRSIVTNALLAAGEASVPRLLKAIELPHVRGFAIETLLQLGPKAKAAKSAVLPLAKDADPQIRAVSVAALVSIAGDDADVLELAVAALGDPSIDVRRAAAHALAGLGKGAKPVETELKKHANDEDPIVRGAITYVLAVLAE
jgi:HEAT repeat protein